MNIFKLEFKNKFKSMLIWTASALAFGLIVILFIPTMVEQGQDFGKIVESMGTFAEIMNIQLDTFTSVLGIIGMYFGMLLIIFGIQASNYGFGLVTVEESELTADFLLTKPLKRRSILTSKLLASFAIMLITCVIYVAASYYTIEGVAGKYDYDKTALLMILCSAFFVQLFFFSVSLLISLFLKKIKSVTPFSMGLVFALYILSAFARSFDIEFLEYFNPFSFFDPSVIAMDNEYNTTFLIINACIVVVSITISYFLYEKRDIKSV